LIYCIGSGWPFCVFATVVCFLFDNVVLAPSSHFVYLLLLFASCSIMLYWLRAAILFVCLLLLFDNVVLALGSHFAWFFFFINPAVSEANMVDTCKHFEIGSGSVRSLSHLAVFVIEQFSARHKVYYLFRLRNLQ